jgi:hypothetical protein
MFANNSRYYGLATYAVILPDGRVVTAVRCAVANGAPIAGYHRKLGSERLDLLAARYLNDPTTFWRLCDSNGTLIPDSLAASDLIGIPTGSSGT